MGMTQARGTLGPTGMFRQSLTEIQMRQEWTHDERRHRDG